MTPHQPLPQNAFKRAIAEHRRQIGFWLTTGSPTVTEIAAGAGFDWLLVDMEHAANDLTDVVDHLRAAEGGTAEPAVRIPWNDTVVIKRVLDAGARTLMIPYVESAEEARAAVRATRYPPEGVRGFAGGSRATRYGRVKDYARNSAEAICVIAQIETPRALAAIPQIAAVDGIDGLFIGPNDLAANMGHLARASAPPVQEAIRSALAPIRAAGKAAGLLNYDEASARQQFEAGFSFIAVAGDSSLLARATERIAATFRT
jgi:4-hydroxy-2-oxoheptanedioate aldolase